MVQARYRGCRYQGRESRQPPSHRPARRLQGDRRARRRPGGNGRRGRVCRPRSPGRRCGGHRRLRADRQQHQAAQRRSHRDLGAATALQSQAAQLKPFADYETMAKARVQTVRDLAGSRFDWEQALRDLSRAVPADVSLTQLSGDISSGAGGGGSSLRSAISAPAITLTGCAPGQTQVARLMARLNNIDGVTRVSLSRSVRRGGHFDRPGRRPTSSSSASHSRAASASRRRSRWSSSSRRTPPPWRRRRRPRPAPSARRRPRPRRATPAAGEGTTSASTTTEQPQGGATP